MVLFADLSTYAIEDFIPFTAEVYRRLVERQNATMWPGHVFTIATGVVAIVFAWRCWGRAMAVLLAAAWGWVAWSFHVRLFSELTWTANYFAGAFALQALLMLAAAWFGAFDGQRFRKPMVVRILGIAIAAAGLIVFPLLAWLTEHGWVASETFAMTPDPTVAVTLGLLLASTARRVWYFALLPLPLVWCAVAGGIEVTLGVPLAWMMPAVASAAAACALAELLHRWCGRRSETASAKR